MFRHRLLYNWTVHGKWRYCITALKSPPVHRIEFVFLEVHISATRRPIDMRSSLSDSPVHDAPSNMDFDPTLRDFGARDTW